MGENLDDVKAKTRFQKETILTGTATAGQEDKMLAIGRVMATRDDAGDRSMRIDRFEKRTGGRDRDHDHDHDHDHDPAVRM